MEKKDEATRPLILSAPLPEKIDTIFIGSNLVAQLAPKIFLLAAGRKVFAFKVRDENDIKKTRADIAPQAGKGDIDVGLSIQHGSLENFVNSQEIPLGNNISADLLVNNDIITHISTDYDPESLKEQHYVSFVTKNSQIGVFEIDAITLNVTKRPFILEKLYKNITVPAFDLNGDKKDEESNIASIKIPCLSGQTVSKTYGNNLVKFNGQPVVLLTSRDSCSVVMYINNIPRLSISVSTDKPIYSYIYEDNNALFIVVVCERTLQQYEVIVLESETMQLTSICRKAVNLMNGDAVVMGACEVLQETKLKETPYSQKVILALSSRNIITVDVASGKQEACWNKAIKHEPIFVLADKFSSKIAPINDKCCNNNNNNENEGKVVPKQKKRIVPQYKRCIYIAAMSNELLCGDAFTGLGEGCDRFDYGFRSSAPWLGLQFDEKDELILGVSDDRLYICFHPAGLKENMSEKGDETFKMDLL